MRQQQRSVRLAMAGPSGLQHDAAGVITDQRRPLKPLIRSQLFPIPERDLAPAQLLIMERHPTGRL